MRSFSSPSFEMQIQDLCFDPLLDKITLVIQIEWWKFLAFKSRWSTWLRRISVIHAAKLHQLPNFAFGLCPTIHLSWAPPCELVHFQLQLKRLYYRRHLHHPQATTYGGELAMRREDKLPGSEREVWFTWRGQFYLPTPGETLSPDCFISSLPGKRRKGWNSSNRRALRRPIKLTIVEQENFWSRLNVI